jgi:hypothetical protein
MAGSLSKWGGNENVTTIAYGDPLRTAGNPRLEDGVEESVSSVACDGKTEGLSRQSQAHFDHRWLGGLAGIVMKKYQTMEESHAPW